MHKVSSPAGCSDPSGRMNGSAIHAVVHPRCPARAVPEAARNLSPALIANYCFELAKDFNQFYHDLSILSDPDESRRIFRIGLSDITGRIIETAMDLLGIEVPERM